MKTKLNYKDIEGIDPSEKKQNKALREGLILWIFPPLPNSEPLTERQKNGREQSRINGQKAQNY